MYDLIPFDRRTRDLSFFFDPFDRRAFRSLAQNLGSFRTDILEEDDRYVLQAELPGFRREDISIDVTEDRLTVSAKVETADEDDKAPKGYVHRERCSRDVSRVFSISGIQNDAISAAFENGVLTVTLPKAAPKKPEAQKIEIR